MNFANIIRDQDNYIPIIQKYIDDEFQILTGENLNENKPEILLGFLLQ